MKRFLLALLLTCFSANADAGENKISPNAMQVTPTGGTQGTLANALAFETLLGTTATTTNPHKAGAVTTGFFSDTASQVQVSCNGVEMMRINQTGVGINAIAPTTYLDVGTAAPSTATVLNAQGTAGRVLAFADTTGITAGKIITGTGIASGTVISSVASYAASATGATSAASAAGSRTLTFSSLPSGVYAGMKVTNVTSPTVLPDNTVVTSTTATVAYISTTATGAGVGSGDVIKFDPAIRLSKDTSTAVAASTVVSLYGNNTDANIATGATIGGDLTVQGNINLPYTYGSGGGVINMGGIPVFHAYQAPGTQASIDGSGSGANLFVGYDAGNFTMAIGSQSYHASRMTGVGHYAFHSITTAGDSAAFGAYSSSSLTSGTSVATFGSYSGFSATSGGVNTLMGYKTGYFNVTGSYNTCVGGNSCYGVSTNSNSNNTALGYKALFGVTTGSSNTVIGYQVGLAHTSGSNNLLIGTSSLIDTTATTTSNELKIGGGATPVLSATGIDATPATTIGGTISMPNMANVDTSVTGAVCWNTGGAVTYNSSTTCLLSSKRYKDLLGDVSGATKELMALRPATYLIKGKHELGEQVGLIAEEVLDVDKRLVAFNSKKEPAAVRYENLTAILVKAFQEQQEEITKLKNDKAYSTCESFLCVRVNW